MIPEAVKAHLSRINLDRPLTVQEVIALQMKATKGTLFRRWNAWPDMAIGITGDRGTGKSVSSGFIGWRDYMMLLQPCYSTSFIKVSLDIDEEMEALLQEYEDLTGMKIERVPPIYESQPVDIPKLFSEDPPYHDGVILVEEFNIELADSWRSGTNQSLASSDFMQQLRKLRSALIFNCISELFVPNRVRDAVDLFIRTSDSAFDNDSPYYGAAQGTHINWELYAMSARVAGSKRTWDSLKRPYQTIQLRGKRLWGIVDTMERKHRTKHINSLYAKNAPEGEQPQGSEQIRDNMKIEIKESQKVTNVRAEWGWLLDHSIVRRMLATGAPVSNFELLDALADDIPESLQDDEVLNAFERYLNPRKTYSAGKKVYSFGVRTQQRARSPEPGSV